MLKRFAVITICVALVAVLAACATFTKDAYQSLNVSYQAYDGTMKALADLYKDKQLTEDQKASAIKLGTFYMSAHNHAVQALANYEKDSSAGNKDKYLDAAEEVAYRLSSLIEMAQPLLFN